MRVSVIICTYSSDRTADTVLAVRSVLNQTYRDVEVILVVDHNESLYRRLRDELSGVGVRVLRNSSGPRGLSASRNLGIKHSSGDVIAFLDDDAVAHPRWIESLIPHYDREDVVGVGGPILPIWYRRPPRFLPEEFYWILGVSYKGQRDSAGEVSHTFGSNISFRREIFDEVGLFNVTLGRTGEVLLGGEETEFCERIREKNPSLRIYYEPSAVVYHRVYPYRLTLRYILRRLYYVGRGIAMISLMHRGGERGARKTYSSFLREVLGAGLFRRAKRALLLREPLENCAQMLAIPVFTAVVGLGYLVQRTSGLPSREGESYRTLDA